MGGGRTTPGIVVGDEQIGERISSSPQMQFTTRHHLQIAGSVAAPEGDSGRANDLRLIPL